LHFTRAHTAHAGRCVCAAVCKAVIDTIDKSITDAERKDVVLIEKKMFQWCASSKGKDKTMVSSHAAAHG
jgi:formaldehyde-activating enzyme involved in methanogenesis